MYVSATSRRLSFGRSTPTRRAICCHVLLHVCGGRVCGGRVCGRVVPRSALTLLVPGVGADNHDPAMHADDPALAADPLDARLDLHGYLSSGRTRDEPARLLVSEVLFIRPSAPRVRDRLARMRRTSLVSVDDAPATQVVGAELHDDPVIGEDPDVVHPHLPADVGEHLVPIVQLHAEKGIRQRLDYRALNLDGAVFLGHILRASLIGLPAPATAGLSG